MPRTVRMMMLASALMTLTAGCATTATVGTSPAVCAQWRGVSWSGMDTPTTIDEIKASNRRRKAWCG